MKFTEAELAKAWNANPYITFSAKISLSFKELIAHMKRQQARKKKGKKRG